MKLLYLILFVFIFTFASTNSQWKKVYQYEKSVQQWDLDCTDSLNCISLASPGATGSMYIKTIDGGSNWFIAYADTATKIFNEQGQWIDTKSPKFKAARCIDFVTPNFVVVGHIEGQISLSKDGGYTWDSIQLNTKKDIIKIKFLDENYGIAFGGYKTLFKTYNGGLDWEEFNLNYFGSEQENYGTTEISIDLVGKDSLIAVIYNYKNSSNKFYTLAKTLDGGKNWNLGSKIPKNSDFKPFFIGMDEGWLAGRVGAGNQKYYDVIYYTSDGGQTWETQLDTILYPESGLTGGIYFANHYEGLAYGEGKIWRTTDGGKNWINEVFPWTEMDAFTKLVFPKRHTYKIIANEYLKGRIWMYENPTSVNNYETNHSNYIIYPNPTSDFITISLGSFGACSNENNNVASPNASIEIYDVMGILVTQTPTSVFNSQTKVLDLPRIDISHLPAGVYFMKVGNRFEKFVKI